MKILITGGAGFIGINCAEKFGREGHDILIYDNLSRPGSRSNLSWLEGQIGENWRFREGDIRDFDRVCQAVSGVDVVIHLASQVAVTTSVSDPRPDFEINALGTFNLLEAIRLFNPGAAFLYASTNKVYGGMENVRITEAEKRYHYSDFTDGIPENFPLDFHSPYGCSKGTGDQYTIDYGRIYGLRTLSLRQSCIYGPRQFGVEDQGWIAHFIIAACTGRTITIFGDGKQVRDVLHISDLLHAYELSIKNIDRVKGTALNIGGGPDNALSIWNDFGPMLEDLLGRQLSVSYKPWRPGDQRVFISSIRRARERLGWIPKVSPEQGIPELFTWVTRNADLFNTEAKLQAL